MAEKSPLVRSPILNSSGEAAFPIFLEGCVVLRNDTHTIDYKEWRCAPTCNPPFYSVTTITQNGDLPTS